LWEQRTLHRWLRGRFGDAAGHDRDVHRQLSERHRFRVRLPSEMAVRHPLEYASGRLRFLFQFL
jgi:hypothetical protein